LLQVSIILVVFILLLFNLGGWFLWRVSLERLDQRLDQRMLDMGRVFSLYLESLPLSADEAVDSSNLQEAHLYLQDFLEDSPAERVFIFTRDGQVLYDSAGEVEPGQSEPLLQADRTQLEKMWSGQPASTTFYPVEQGYAKRTYIPLRDWSGQTVLGLGLQAGAGAFADLYRFRRALWTLSIVSAVVAVAVILILSRVIRRARRLEDMIRRTERALEAGQLTAALAHEIRNPLGIMRTNAEYLSERVPENLKVVVQDVLEEVDRLSLLIARFFDLGSQRPGRMQSCSLHALLGRVLERHARRLEKSPVEIKVHPDAGSDEVPVQPDRIEGIIYNLLDNAMHALESAERPVLEISIRAKRKKVEMEFRDNGPGFSTEALKSASEPFYSGRTKGTGLGLAIARRVMEDHGGTLLLKNHPGGGAVIILRFPRRK
jgi:signal transduction histidine kinase